MQFIWFLGRFHVLVLHLPLGILTLAVALEILTRFKTFQFLKPALAPTWIAGAVTAIATVALGYMHASEDSFQDMPAVEAHRMAGVTLALVTCLIALLRTRMLPAPTWPKWAGPEGVFAPVYRAVQPAFAPGSKLDTGYDKLWALPVAVILLLMFLTGHLGGNLTHGDTYLVQYAPGPIRMLAGLPPNAGPRPKPKDLASADLFLDVVQPALEQRCSGCHNNSKKSGGFSVATYDTLMKGGNKGPVIVAGNPSGSDLFHRVNLTPDNGDFMPKDGKTPLNKNEIAAVGAWIQQGAPKSALVGGLKLAAADTNAIQAVIGAQGAAAGADEIVAYTPLPGEGPLPTAPEADKAAVAKLVSEGFIVRKVARNSNLVDIDYILPKPVTPEAIADLAKLGPNILRLNLRRAGVTDAEIKTIAGFTNLRQLRLEENPITDASAKDIAGLKEITYLNLTNTKVTDSGFDQVSSLPKLRRMYVWGTTITPAAVDKVKATRKDMILYAGLTAKDVKPETKVMSPTN
ncbi:MAG: c-type cytochrome domain-containing protein [Caulobacteraceae bacterium]